MDDYWLGKHVHKADHYGHIEYLGHAWKKGCPLDDETLEESFKFGHSDSFKFSHEHICALNKKQMKNYTLTTALNAF